MIHDRPRINPGDIKALLGLVVFVALLFAICAVDPTGMAGPR